MQPRSLHATVYGIIVSWTIFPVVSVLIVFAVAPIKVLVFTKAPYSQTRFTFAHPAAAE